MTATDKKLYENMTPGERVKAKRLHKKWTQEELARRSGVHASNISLIESGAPIGPLRAMKLSKALNMRLDALYTIPENRVK